MRKIQQSTPLDTTMSIGERRLHAWFLPLLWLIFASTFFSACAPTTNLLGSGSWEAFSLTRQHIHALAVDPTHQQTLYAGDEDGTIFKTSDAGLHWTKQASISSTATTLFSLTIAPSGKTLYALASDGLLVSSDAAQTWNRVNTAKSGLPVDTCTTLVFDGQKSLYLGTLRHGVFMISDGEQWKSISGTLPRDTAINELAYDSVQHRLWAATSSGVYRSDNEGTNWNALNTGLSVADGVTTIQAAANAGGDVAQVYAGTKHGIFRSTDSGMHWTAAGQLLQGVSIQHVLIDYRSTNAATVYVGTPFGAFRSDDSGQNWRGVGGGLPEHTPVYALVIGGDNASQLYAAVNNVYVFPGSNSGITPTRVITLLLALLLFVLLFFIAQRGVRRRKTLLKPVGDANIHPKKD